VSRAVAANPEIEELVERLEAEQADRRDLEDDVPSGEALARDFERYLRQQGSSPD
jgi:alpha-mannosidase